MSSLLVSLAWDGHHRTLVSVFEKLLVNSYFVDCTIAAEGRKIKAHKEVLSAFSPFFKLLFKEETEKNPTVIISGISFRDLSSLVDFMYQGKLEVTEDRIQDLIDAAECLQIEGLGGGHKEDDLGNINNTTVLSKRPALASGIPKKRTGKAENEDPARVIPKTLASSSDTHRKRTRRDKSEEAASVVSKESKGNNLNYSNEKRHEDSVVVSCGAKQTSVRNLTSNSDVQNVAIASNIPLMPSQSSLIEMNSLHLQGECVVKEPDSGGDVNVNEPMRDRRNGVLVCENSGNSYENSGEETILGLSSDIIVPSEKNVCYDLPLDCISPTVQSSQLSNINVNLSSVSVDPIASAVEAGDPLLYSEFHMRSENATFLSVDNGLLSENDGLCTERENNSSEATSGYISESTYSPLQLPTAIVKIQRIGRSEPAVGLMSGLPAQVTPHDSPTHPLYTTSVCDRGLPGPSRRDGGKESSSPNQQYRCQICGKTFIHNWSLNIHKRIHAKNRLFRNDKCNNAAITSIKLNKQRGRAIYNCTLCDFKSVHYTAFHVHMRNHKGFLPYKCTQCEYTCAYVSRLKIHQQTHIGYKPYKCSECGYAAASNFHLKRHQRIHSGVKPYKCSECNYASARRDALKSHQRIHSRLKP